MLELQQAKGSLHTRATIREADLDWLLHRAEGIEVCYSHCAEAKCTINTKPKTSQRRDTGMCRNFASRTFQQITILLTQAIEYQ